ncbi:MAG TPA: hypothetical protein VF857_00815, partial [Spirochaetota bacterium]
IVTFLLINFQLIAAVYIVAHRVTPLIAKTASGSNKGIVAFTGHGGTRVGLPIVEYIITFFTHTTPAIPILAIGYFSYFAATFKKRSAIEKLLVFFFVAFTALLSFGKVASGNYFLPQGLLSHMFAAFAIILLGRYLIGIAGTFKTYSIVAALIIIVIGTSFPYARDALAQHSPGGDTRKKLITWMGKNMKTKATVIADGYVLLPDLAERNFSLESRKLISVESVDYTGDLKTLEFARKLGFTHIAVCHSTYARFFNPANRPAVGSEEIYRTRKNFYSALFEKGKLLWEGEGKYGGVINESIRLYSIEDIKVKESE